MVYVTTTGVSDCASVLLVSEPEFGVMGMSVVKVTTVAGEPFPPAIV